MRQPFITLVEEGKTYKVTEEDLIAIIGEDCESVPTARKHRYGVDLAWKQKPGYYDERDSGIVYQFISIVDIERYFKNKS